MRNWLKRLERLRRDDGYTLPQRDGSVKHFPEHELIEAYRSLYGRLGAGADAPPEHPMLGAARNSSDSEWATSPLAEDPGLWTRPVEDLSEPG
jgi:hypothetical protein